MNISISLFSLSMHYLPVLKVYSNCLLGMGLEEMRSLTSWSPSSFKVKFSDFFLGGLPGGYFNWPA